MLALMAIAYLAGEGSDIDPRPPVPNSEAQPQRTPPVTNFDATSVDTKTSYDLIVPANPASRQMTVQRHGGLLRDGRAELVSRVAERLCAAARKTPVMQSETFQVGVLADERARQVYVYPDGWILVTAGLIQVAATENEVAALLAESMELIVNTGSSPAATPIGATSASVMARAGYDPRGISSFRARWASLQRRDPR